MTLFKQWQDLMEQQTDETIDEFWQEYAGAEKRIYQDILKETGASSATISRVNRCLQYGAGGYQTITERLGFGEESE